jgi:nucleotide-binding universal stress UspA family protein
MTAQAGGEHEHRIVVGVDGSAPSKAALAWAARQARLTGAVVEAVIAWDVPAITGYPVPVTGVNWEELATEIVTGAIAEIAASAEPLEIRHKVAHGNAAQVLLDAAAGADLLVVGSRGHGGFAKALLGSTSQHAVHHATCPVVVIRDSVTGQQHG